MNFVVSASTPFPFPVEMLFGLLFVQEDEVIEIPNGYPIFSEWGKTASNVYDEPKDYSIPKYIDVVYLSIIEEKFYSLEKELRGKVYVDKWSAIEKGYSSDFPMNLVVGLAPYGLVALWLNGDSQSTVISVFKADPIEVEMADFRTDGKSSLSDICQQYVSKFPQIKNHIDYNGYPLYNLFDKYMQQFTYRYLPIYEKWDGGEEQWAEYEEDEKRGSELDYIEETLYDGTHDKLHDGGLMEYHQAGKPKKLHVQWHIGKSEYSAYFWFEDERIREVFDKFYGAHPDTKTDFIIRIDAGQRKYELALYRYGLKESQVIPEDAYQLLVFKNKFEDYRSENYNQERGAWIW